MGDAIRRIAWLIIILILGLLVAPLAAEAQPPALVFRIAELNPSSAPGQPQEVFRQRLRDLGYMPGQNLIIEDRFAAGSEARLRAYAAELVRLKVDVIVAVSSSAVRAASQATSTIPIVALDLETDPVGSGLAASLARPGGNVTGVFLDLPEFNGKRLELLGAAIPGLTRVAVLWDPTMDSVPLRVTLDVARSLGMQLHTLEVGGPDELEGVFRAATEARVGAVMVIPSPLLDSLNTEIADLAMQHRLPMTSLFPHTAEAGALMSYGPNLHELFRRAATYVAKILQGAKPGDLPIERPSRYDLVLNLKTARALGLTIPPMLLFQADEVLR